ncbi:hypothetical protein IP70_12960 [alpha proteobacterium AAP38]|nr:hypothetical protein IP70_12960 [alpha proteobacterium AAP38]
MRLLSALTLLLLLTLPSLAGVVGVSGQPTAFPPGEGALWLGLEVPEDNVAAVSVGMRPVRPLAVTVRQGDWGAQTDVTLELAEARGLLPNLVLDSSGHGGDMTGRLDSLLLGWTRSGVEVTAGAARSGMGDVRPVLQVLLPVKTPVPFINDTWIRAGIGGVDGPMLGAGWSPEPGRMLSITWLRGRGLVAGITEQIAGDDLSQPYFGRSRQHDAGAWTDIGPFMSPGGALHAALADQHPTSDRVSVASHRLGLPGVSARLYAPDLRKWKRHRISAAEIRRGTRFERAPTPGNLAHHWEMTLDATMEVEAGPRGYPAASRASAGAQLHLLPWSGLILTAEGRVANAGNIPPPRWYPPSKGRDDAALYLYRRFSLDRAQMAFAHAVTPSLDVLAEIGHLDPMYGGGGGELRYQQLTARWSLGLAAHYVWKRPPSVETLYRGSGRTTGFMNAGWEGPDGGSRSELSFGRYLAGDLGMTFTLRRQFGWGLELGMDATATTRTSRLGLSVTLPLIGLGQHVDTLAHVKVRPLAREYAERLDRAITLSDLRHTAGYARVVGDWDRGFRRR